MKLKAIANFAVSHLGKAIDKGTDLVKKRQEKLAQDEADRLEQGRNDVVLVEIEELLRWDEFSVAEEAGADLARALVDRHAEELARLTIDCSKLPPRLVVEDFFHAFLGQVQRSATAMKEDGDQFLRAARKIHWKPKFLLQRAKIDLWVSSYK